MRAPCANCERRGCGSFHDECEAYQEWKKTRPKRESDIYRTYVSEQIAKRKHREGRQGRRPALKRKQQ